MRLYPVAAMLLAACSWIDRNEFGDRMDLDGDGVEGLVDCDDRDVSVQEPATWYRDRDGDGSGDGADFRLGCEQPKGFVDNKDDCDDTSEFLNALDEDGDGSSTCDEEPDCDDTDRYRNLWDNDEDGFTTCDEDPDCDDNVAAIHPGADEQPGDALDQDCDGVDLCFVDGDEDGARHDTETALSTGVLCLEEGLLLEGAPLDCNDDDAAIRPGQLEQCNKIDDDCDGLVDDEAIDQVPWYFDYDGDGAGGEYIVALGCDAPSNYVSAGNAFDCDDADPDKNQTDYDVDGWTTCDGDCEDGDSSLNLNDDDGDGWTTCDDDCDDNDVAIFPGATDEPYDGVDSNCDDENDFDSDNDDFMPHQVTHEDAFNTYIDALYGGTPPFPVQWGDCDDSVSTTYPGAIEWCGDYTTDANGRVFIDSDCDNFHYLPDTVTSLLGGVKVGSIEHPNDGDAEGLFSQFDVGPLGGEDVQTLDPSFEIDEIGFCGRSGQAPWLVSLDLQETLENGPLRISGYGDPSLDGSPGGAVFFATEANAKNDLVVSNVTIADGQVNTSWLDFVGTPLSPMSVALLDVDFGGPEGRYPAASRFDMISGTNITLTLANVDVNGVSDGAQVNTFLSCTDCNIFADWLGISDSNFLDQAMNLVESNSHFGAFEGRGIAAVGDGAVAMVQGGIVDFTPDTVIMDPDYQLGDGEQPVLGLNGLTGRIQSCSTQGSGGALFVGGDAVVDLDIPNMEDNSAVGDGGLVFGGADSFVRIHEASIKDNDANRGGAIFTSGSVDITSGTLVSNSATTKGGAIYLSTGGSLRSWDSGYEGNDAATGGAVYADRGSFSTYHEGDEFSRNTADEGGAIFVQTSATIIQSSFTENATEIGGAGAALALRSAFVRDVGSDFIGNDPGTAVAVDLLSGLLLVEAGVWGDDVFCLYDDVNVVTHGDPVASVPESTKSYMCGYGEACFEILLNP